MGCLVVEQGEMIRPRQVHAVVVETDAPGLCGCALIVWAQATVMVANRQDVYFPQPEGYRGAIDSV